MKTAEEMFEELGYELWEANQDTFLLYEDKNDKYSIRFNLNEKSVSIFYNPDEECYSQEIGMSFNLLKAINKQIEELGWLDE